MENPSRSFAGSGAWTLPTRNASVIALYILHQNRNISPTAWRKRFLRALQPQYDVPLTLAVAVGNAESH